MKMKSLILGKLFLLCMVLTLSWQQARADITAVYGINNGGAIQCASSTEWYAWIFASGSLKLESSDKCSITSNKYIPKTGYYKVETIVVDSVSNNSVIVASSNSFLLDETKTLAQQSIHVSASTKTFSGSQFGQVLCQYISDDAGNLYTSTTGNGCNNGNVKPLPPTPHVPDTSCTLNDGNTLNVNLSTIDRAQLPTVPGSGSMRHIQVPVDCTGGDVTVNMQLNYTPITVGANQIIKSTANGLGVSVVYDSKVLSSSDVTPVTFLEGSNSVDLAFQAVRDPTVETKDIPTGAFTASAVLVMTQQ